MQGQTREIDTVVEHSSGIELDAMTNRVLATTRRLRGETGTRPKDDGALVFRRSELPEPMAAGLCGPSGHADQPMPAEPAHMIQRYRTPFRGRGNAQAPAFGAPSSCNELLTRYVAYGLRLAHCRTSLGYIVSYAAANRFAYNVIATVEFQRVPANPDVLYFRDRRGFYVRDFPMSLKAPAGHACDQRLLLVVCPSRVPTAPRSVLPGNW